LEKLVHETEEGQEEVLVPFVGRILFSKRAFEIGEDGEEKTGLKHEVKRGLCHAFLQIAKKFVSKTGGRTLPNLFSMVENGLVGLVLNHKVRAGGMTNHSDHANRILMESFSRVSDGPNDPLPEIGHPSHTVNDGKIGDIVKQAVDRNITAHRVFFGSSKALRVDDFPFLCLEDFKF
jgi:hypothetical protein